MNKSDARKNYWANISVEERQKRASKMAKGRWARTTPEQRSEYARKIINIRWTKYINTKKEQSK